MATKMIYSVIVSLYTKTNINLNEKDKAGKPLAVKEATGQVSKFVLTVQSASELTAAQLKAEVKKSTFIPAGVTETVTCKGAELKDSDLVTEVMVAYSATLNSVPPTATTTTAAPASTTTTTTVSN